MSDTGKSEPTILVELLAEAIEGALDIMVEEWPHPFAMEKLSKREAKRRYLAMTPRDRMGELSRVGVRGIRELMEG